MRYVDAETIEAMIDRAELADSLESFFRKAVYAPDRQVLPVPGGDQSRQLLIMPAFADDGSGVVKLATIFPENSTEGLPTIQGVIVTFSQTGTPEYILDGACVTRLRTAAASALASRYLSRRDARRLLIVGTGALAPYLAAAHASMRSIEAIGIWGRNSDRVDDVIERLEPLVAASVTISKVVDLPSAVNWADIVSCATSAKEPIIKGRWLSPGTFLDLVGSFSPQARECDDDAVKLADIYVDTLEGALAEAGDILQPLESEAITKADIAGGIADLVVGRVPGRINDHQITLFKSVGTAVEDLAAASLIVDQLFHREKVH